MFQHPVELVDSQMFYIASRVPQHFSVHPLCSVCELYSLENLGSISLNFCKLRSSNLINEEGKMGDELTLYF